MPAVTPASDATLTPPPQGARIAAGFRVVSLLTLVSRILGMVRDMVMAYAFGAGPLMDAFTVAFRIPNLARRLFGEGALTTSFLPVFVRELETEGQDAARRVATAVTITLSAFLLGIVLIGEVLLGLVWLVTPAGSDGRVLIMLTAQMLPYLLLVCVAAQLSAVLQSLERFFWPALLPTILNVIWIVTALVSVQVIETPYQQIQAVSLSIVLAGIVQCVIGGWAMHAAGFHFARRWRSARHRVREISGTMLPVVLGLSIAPLNSIVDNLLAWGLARPTQATGPMWGEIDWPLEPGTASALFFAQRMFTFPSGVIGIALGTVLFPLLTRHVERGEMDQVGRDLTLGLRLVIAIGLPASIGLMLLSRPIALLFFQRGAFTTDDAALTAACILAYGTAVWAALGTTIINRGFYALGDRQTPIRCGMYSIAVNLVLNFVLIWPLAGVGLAAATAVATIVHVGVSLAAYQRKVGLLNLQDAARAIGRTILPTAVMTGVCWMVMTLLPADESFLSRGLAVAGPVLAAIGSYLLTAKLVGLTEPFLLLTRGIDDGDL